MGGPMSGVLVVASFGLPMMPGRNGQGAEDGCGYRQQECKREEETVLTDQPRRASAIGQGDGDLSSWPCLEKSLGERTPSRTASRLECL